MNEDATFADVVAAIDRLAGNIERLETAVMKLGARLRQPDNEMFALPDWRTEMKFMLVRRIPRDVKGICIAVAATRARIDKIDLHVGAMRAYLDAIKSDADERVTFRKWLGNQQDQLGG